MPEVRSDAGHVLHEIPVPAAAAAAAADYVKPNAIAEKNLRKRRKRQQRVTESENRFDAQR